MHDEIFYEDVWYVSRYFDQSQQYHVNNKHQGVDLEYKQRVDVLLTVLVKQILFFQFNTFSKPTTEYLFF